MTKCSKGSREYILCDVTYGGDDKQDEFKPTQATALLVYIIS